MPSDNKLLATLLVAFAALACAAFLTAPLADGADTEAVAGAKGMQIAAAASTTAATRRPA